MLTSSICSKSETTLLFTQATKDGKSQLSVEALRAFAEEGRVRSAFFLLHFPTLPPNSLRSRSFVILDERNRLPLSTA